MKNDAWLSGFADGEGCFGAYRVDRAGGRSYVQPRFDIRLRLDDLAILEQIQRAFGGRIQTLRPPPSAVDNARPQAVWNVRDKRTLRLLIEYFDRFPLRAKKARDYAIWRRIVLLYVARGGAADFEEMETLRVALVDGRAYDSEEVRIDVVPPNPQLRLVG